MILDIPARLSKGNQISAFFCERMEEVSEISFNYGYNDGLCRIILSGNAESVQKVLQSYYAAAFDE